MGVHLHLPHLGHEKKKEGGAAGVPPKGCMTIKVGQEGEEQQRFVVPVMYLNHPLFMGLLKVAEEEYGLRAAGSHHHPMPCRALPLCPGNHRPRQRSRLRRPPPPPPPQRPPVPPRRVLQGLRWIGKNRGREWKKKTSPWKHD